MLRQGWISKADLITGDVCRSEHDEVVGAILASSKEQRNSSKYFKDWVAIYFPNRKPFPHYVLAGVKVNVLRTPEFSHTILLKIFIKRYFHKSRILISYTKW